MSDTRNYQLVYPDPRTDEEEPSGGYVEVHITHSANELRENLDTAIFLAKRGYKIRLLGIDNTPGLKNPDAYFIDEEIIVEFKHNQTPTASAISNELRDAKKQADHILLHINSALTKGDLLRGLNVNIHRAKALQRVWVIFQEQLYCFTPKGILNGTASLKIQ
jgi:hypothetical protein